MQNFVLPIDFMDNYILKSKPEYVLVYLYAYRHKSVESVPDIPEIAMALGMEQKAVTEAVEYWCSKGFDIFTVKKLPNRNSKSGYTETEILEIVSNDKELSVMIEISQKLLGKVFSPDEVKELYHIYNDYGMSTHTIISAVNYAVSIGKTRISSVKKIAYEWADKGILTLNAAENHLKELESAENYEKRLRKHWNLQEPFTPGEKKIIENWCHKLKPTRNELLRAYETCIEKTNGVSIKYIDSVITNSRNQSANPRKANRIPTPKSTKFSNFTSRENTDYKKLEMEALKKRISRSKEGVNNG